MSRYIGWLFAFRPELPPGKGGLILILGGLVVLVCVLFWLSVIPRRPFPAAPSVVTLDATLHAQARRKGAQKFQRSGRVVGRLPRRPETAWRSVLDAARRRAHMGPLELVRAAPDQCIVMVEDCRSCRHRKPRRGCRIERRRLQKGLRAVVGRCYVTEVRCRAAGAGSCAFAVRGDA